MSLPLEEMTQPEGTPSMLTVYGVLAVVEVAPPVVARDRVVERDAGDVTCVIPLELPERLIWPPVDLMLW